MQYKYVKEEIDYSDFASGRVFHSAPGHPAFPVRLASEIFQRCVADREKLHRNTTPCTLYDPCCGAAYHLTVLGFLHREHIREVIGSDIDEQVVSFARQNLDLLSIPGLDRRLGEIATMLDRYKKDSHREALDSGYRLRERIAGLEQEYHLATRTFQSNATDSQTISKNIQAGSVDIVFTDVPYGLHSYWQDTHSHDLVDPISAMLNALIGVLSASGIVAIISDKQQKVAHQSFERIEQFQVGKRRIVILKPI